MPANTQITEQLKADILKDYESGMRQIDILGKYHISFKKLKGILNLPPGRNFRVHYDREQVINDYLAGMPIKLIMVRHKIKSYANVYAIISKKGVLRTKSAKKTWKQTIRKKEEPTCPVILRLREKYRKFEVDTKEIGQSKMFTGLSTFITVQPRFKYRNYKNL